MKVYELCHKCTQKLLFLKINITGTIHSRIIMLMRQALQHDNQKIIVSESRLRIFTHTTPCCEKKIVRRSSDGCGESV